MEFTTTINCITVYFVQEYGVLRIKFLGDCYYCVSGVPKPNPQHARSCVDLGLRMIRDIREVRAQRNNLNIDMRIGVHSGSIMSGVIGACKWQYDIWSKDVSIANRLETTGVPGYTINPNTVSNSIKLHAILIGIFDFL